MPPLMLQHGYSASQTQSIFGLCIVTSTMTMIYAGKILHRLGFRQMILLTGGLLIAAYLLASHFCDDYVILLLAMGLLFGLSIGFGYITVLSLAARLFPYKSGMACGAVVAGYGCGAILLANLAERMLDTDYSVPQIFTWIGLVYGTTIILCGMFIQYSDNQDIVKKPEKLSRPLFQDKKYWAMTMGMFAISFPGLMVIGNLKPIGLSYDHSGFVLKTSMLLMALGNSTGRLIWGGLYDKLESRTIFIMFIFLIIAMLIFLFLSSNKYLFCMSTFAVVFGFSSCAVVYPANVVRVYGATLFSDVYPWIIVFHGLAGFIAGLVGGACYDTFLNYHLAIAVSVIIAAFGMIVQFLLSRNHAKIINAS